MHDTIEVRELGVRYGETVAIEGLSLAIRRQAVTVLAGPNGCGKSTLLRALRRLQRPTIGSVLLEGADVASLGEKELARRVSLLTQAPGAPDELTVEDLVRLGRYPHLSVFRGFGRRDMEAVEAALESTDLLDLRTRRLDQLSGGQRQRAWIAMVLAQDTEFVCLDEPINHLDLAHQVECLELVVRLKRAGKTVIVVLHDLNLAGRYADDLVLMRDGRIQGAGPPQELITEDTVRTVFGIRSRVIADPVYGRPLCIPIA